MLDRARTTSGLYTLSTSKVASLQIPVPPLAEQKRIVAVLNEQMTAVECAKRAAQDQLAEIDLGRRPTVAAL